MYLSFYLGFILKSDILSYCFVAPRGRLLSDSYRSGSITLTIIHSMKVNESDAFYLTSKSMNLRAIWILYAPSQIAFIFPYWYRYQCVGLPRVLCFYVKEGWVSCEKKKKDLIGFFSEFMELGEPHSHLLPYWQESNAHYYLSTWWF